MSVIIDGLHEEDYRERQMSRDSTVRSLEHVDADLFSFESACHLLSDTEHAPLSQQSSDALWVELRLALAKIKRLREAST